MELSVASSITSIVMQRPSGIFVVLDPTIIDAPSDGQPLAVNGVDLDITAALPDDYEIVESTTTVTGGLTLRVETDGRITCVSGADSLVGTPGTVALTPRVSLRLAIPIALVNADFASGDVTGWQTLDGDDNVPVGDNWTISGAGPYAAAINSLDYVRLMIPHGQPAGTTIRVEIDATITASALKAFLTRLGGDPTEQFAGADNALITATGVTVTEYTVTEFYDYLGIARRYGTEVAQAEVHSVAMSLVGPVVTATITGLTAEIVAPAPPLEITGLAAALPAMRVGRPLDTALTGLVSGGTAPYTLSLDAAPAGVTITDGVLTGAPTTPGTGVTLTLRAVDAESTAVTSVVAVDVSASDADVVAFLDARQTADGIPMAPEVWDANYAGALAFRAMPDFDQVTYAGIYFGSSTAAGVLVPLVGSAPTNNGFNDSMLAPAFGLQGNGAVDLDTGDNLSSAYTNDCYFGAFVTEEGNSASLFGNDNAGDGTINLIHSITGLLRNMSGTSQTDIWSGRPMGLLAAMRNPGFVGTSVLKVDDANGDTVQTNASIPATNPSGENLKVFNRGVSDSFSTARIGAFVYGHFLDHDVLKTVLTDWIAAVQAVLIEPVTVGAGTGGFVIDTDLTASHVTVVVSGATPSSLDGTYVVAVSDLSDGAQNMVVPAIENAAGVLSVTHPGLWLVDGAASLTYQWRLAGTPIAGANELTYDTGGTPGTYSLLVGVEGTAVTQASNDVEII